MNMNALHLLIVTAQSLNDHEKILSTELIKRRITLLQPLNIGNMTRFLTGIGSAVMATVEMEESLITTSSRCDLGYMVETRSHRACLGNTGVTPLSTLCSRADFSNDSRNAETRFRTNFQDIYIQAMMLN